MRTLLLLLLCSCCALGRISGGQFDLHKKVKAGSTPDSSNGTMVPLSTFSYLAGKGRVHVIVKDSESIRHCGFFVKQTKNPSVAKTMVTSDHHDSLCGRSNVSRYRNIEPVVMEEKNGNWEGLATITADGFWTLFFYSCEKFQVEITVHVEEYNIIDGKNNYLQVGDWPLPTMYVVFFAIYTLLIGVWGYLMKKVEKLHNLHLLMAVLLVLKCGTMLFESQKYFVFKKTGHGSVWDIFYYTFLMLKGVALFATLLLLGAGWSVMKPFLGPKERKLLIIVIPLQILSNVCSIVLDETVEGDPGLAFWKDALNLFDVVCCIALFLPIGSSISSLKASSSTDGKEAKNLIRTRQFRLFYLVVLFYIYYTRFFVPLFFGNFDWDSTWLQPFFYELGTLFFYMYVGKRFGLNFDDLTLEDIDIHESQRDVEMQPLATSNPLLE